MAKRARLTRAQRRAKYADARHRLSILKSKGLISKRANLRKDKPSSSLLKKEQALRGVLSGTKQAIKVTPKEYRDYREKGYQVAGGRLIVDKQTTDRVKRNKDGSLEIKSQYSRPGFRSIILPVNLRDFLSFYNWLRDHPGELDSQIGPMDYLGFTFYGNPNIESIFSATELADALQHYTPLFSDARRNGDGSRGKPGHVVNAKDSTPAFRHLMLYKLNEEQNDAFQFNRRKNNAKPKTVKHRKSTGKPYTPTERKRHSREKLKSDPKAYRAYKFEDAARKKQDRVNAKERKT